MEPLKIQIELSVKDETLKQLKTFASLVAAVVMTKADPGAVESLMNAIKTDAKPAAEGETETAPVEDMPADIADPISDDTVLEVVARKKKGNASSIKAIFAKYGCTCSTGCPQEHRAAMIADIEALPDHA